MSVYVNRSSFMDGLRAIPTTRAPNRVPMPCAQPPTATIAMAQPSTDTPALRLLRGWPRPVAAGATTSLGAAAGAARTRPDKAAPVRAALAKRQAWINAIAGDGCGQR